MNAPLNHPERGGALVATVVAIVIVYTLFGALALAVTAQNRFVLRDHHRRQAMYTAEAGIYAALSLLDAGRAIPTTVPALNGDSARINIRTHGAFYLVSSSATSADQSAEARALVGADLGPLREIAIGTMGSGLVLGGTTRIQGSVRAGGEVVPETVGMRPFQGSFQGDALAGPGEPPPTFPLYDRLLDHVRQQRPDEIAPGLPSRIVQGDLSITASDSAAFQTPVAVFATGRLTVSGPLSFAPGTVFASLDTLDVIGQVEGDHALFVSGQIIRVAADVSCSGQFVGRWGIQLAPGASLHYPSVLYAQGGGRRAAAGVAVRSGARIEGTVIAAWPPDPSEVLAWSPAVTLEPGALVRGAILSPGQVDLRGAVEGSAFAGEFVFVDGYSTYHNWVVDASVLLERRPQGFALPIPSTTEPTRHRHLVVAWMPT